ncbi:hypothetical protein D3C85_1913280 [compost metagenome]
MNSFLTMTMRPLDVRRSLISAITPVLSCTNSGRLMVAGWIEPNCIRSRSMSLARATPTSSSMLSVQTGR